MVDTIKEIKKLFEKSGILILEEDFNEKKKRLKLNLSKPLDKEELKHLLGTEFNFLEPDEVNLSFKILVERGCIDKKWEKAPLWFQQGFKLRYIQEEEAFRVTRWYNGYRLEYYLAMPKVEIDFFEELIGDKYRLEKLFDPQKAITNLAYDVRTMTGEILDEINKSDLFKKLAQNFHELSYERLKK